MQNQKERIMDSIERVSNSKQAYNKAKWEREMEFSNLLEQLEALVMKYNSEAKELALIPESAKNAQGKKFMIEINKANAHEVDQSKFLGGVDIQYAAKKSISELKTKYVEQTAELKREFVELQDKYESSKKLSKELLDGIDVSMMKTEGCMFLYTLMMKPYITYLTMHFFRLIDFHWKAGKT
jgi:SMC interacting uncharacterized protein involved in chromosome segregation